MRPKGKFWFYHPKVYGGWQLKLWHLFIFSNIYSFGFRLGGPGISCSVRGIHKMTFSRRYVNKGPVVIEWLHPCNPSRAYRFLRGLFSKRQPA